MRRILAALAIGYLLVMSNPGILHGHNSVQHTHSHKHSDGLITGKLAELSGVVIRKHDRQWQLFFENQQWQYRKETLSGDNLKILQDLLAMLTSSEPVRTFLPEELAHASADDGADYGLAQPILQLSIFAERQPGAANKPQVLAFGHATPDGSLRYARKAGDPALYVMSGFVYEQAQMLVDVLAGGFEN